jgi:hypothetical protein
VLAVFRSFDMRLAFALILAVAVLVILSRSRGDDD